MSFLYPAFLYGLFALSIPIIIHLFHFRRYKTVMFTNVRFLKEVKQQTATRSNLKSILILISRLFAILFMVFAFSQPIIRVEKTTKVKHQEAMSIYIDNSFSMNALGENGTLFDEAKEIARSIVDVHNTIHKIQLLTNDFEGIHQHMVNREQFLTNLDEVKITSSVRTLSSVRIRQQQAITGSGEEEGFLYIISDFQQNITDLESFKTDSNSNTFFIPVRHADQRNIYIDSCWFDEPVLKAAHTVKLVVKVNKTFDQPVEDMQLNLKIDNQNKGFTNFNIIGQSTSIDTISFTVNDTGWHRGEVYMNDYPITFDDSYKFVFEVLPNVGVLCISESKVNNTVQPEINNPPGITYLRAVYNPDPYFMFKEQSVAQVSYSSFPNNKLIILNEVQEISSGMASELKKYIEQGGDVLVLPNGDADLDSYRRFLSENLGTNYFTEITSNERAVDEINIASAIFSDVFDFLPRNLDLPIVKKGFVLSNQSRTNEETLLRFKDGSPFIAKYSYGSGNIYLCTVPLDNNYSNLQAHALFVPLLYKIALLSNDPKPHSYVIGKNESIVIDQQHIGSDEIIKMKKKDFEFIPSQRTVGGKTNLFIHDMIKEDGIYKIVKGAARNPIALAALNYNRVESELSFYEVDELAVQAGKKGIQVLNTWNKNIEQFIANVNQGRPLWKLCIIFVLIFLAVEIMLLKFLN